MAKKSTLYSPASQKPFPLSRSKIELFLTCPRTFYLDRRLGVKAPGIPGFSLNSAVDALLKKEFDACRKKGEPHPLMTANHIDAVPFAHPDMDRWRENFKGVRVVHEPTNLEVFGAVDDLWVNNKSELHVVDYKATSTFKEISLDDKYKQGYKRQAEVYQWLLRRNGFKVSDTAYFVFANALKTPRKFGGKLKFEEMIIPYTGDDSWVEPALYDIKKCLDSDRLPPWGADEKWPNGVNEYRSFVEGTMEAIRKI